jgi:hypothetical protein
VNTAAKIAQLTRLVLRPGIWSERFHDQAHGIPHDEPCDLAEVIRAKIANGAARVAEIVTPSGLVGFIVYSLAFNGRELVLVAGYGRDGRNLTDEIKPHAEALARSLGCSSLRFHTMRPGLVRAAVAAGYHVGEIILRKHL